MIKVWYKMPVTEKYVVGAASLPSNNHMHNGARLAGCLSEKNI